VTAPYTIFRAWYGASVSRNADALMWAWVIALGHKGRTMEHVRR
jgi:hypothetical protein